MNRHSDGRTKRPWLTRCAECHIQFPSSRRLENERRAHSLHASSNRGLAEGCRRVRSRSYGRAAGVSATRYWFTTRAGRTRQLSRLADRCGCRHRSSRVLPPIRVRASSYQTSAVRVRRSTRGLHGARIAGRSTRFVRRVCEVSSRVRGVRVGNRKDLDNVLLVTGGSRGIGAATARLAAQRGYSVCVNYRQNRDSAQRVVKAIEAHGGRALAVAADVSVETDVLRLFETCDSKLGTLTALVNNVGIVETQSAEWKRWTRSASSESFRPTSSAPSSAPAKPCAACPRNAAGPAEPSSMFRPALRGSDHPAKLRGLCRLEGRYGYADDWSG